MSDQVACFTIETTAEADFVKNAGADLLQGFLIAKPAPIELHLQSEAA